MKKANFFLRSTGALIVVLVMSLGFMPTELGAQPPGSGWTLTWEDHFNNLNKWRKRDQARSPRKGFNWFFEADNVSVNSGKLRLKVTKSGNNVYCAAVDTYGKFTQKYGYFEARMKIAPVARGIHSAFWMMAGNPNTKSGGVWSIGNQANDGAEIDVCETVRHPQNTFAAGAIHWDGYGTNHGTANPGYPNAPNIHDNGYHIYGVLWDANKIEIYYDGNKVRTITNVNHISDVAEWLLLSNGVNWGNTSPNGSFPVTTYVDWVKVYKKSSSTFPDPNKWYRLQNRQTGRYLQGRGSGSSPIYNTDTGTGSSDFYKWKFVAVEGSGSNTYYRVVNKAMNRNLWGRGSGSSPSYNVENDGGTNDFRRWKVQDVNGTYKRLIHKPGGRKLQAQGGSASPAYNVKTGTGTDNWYQWKFVESGSARLADDEFSILEEENHPENLVLYPNPANSFVRIDYSGLSTEPVLMTIHDLSGQLIERISTEGGNRTLNVSGWEPGIYFIQVDGADFSVTRRFLVEKQ